MEVEIALDMQGAYDTAGFYLSEWARKSNYVIPQDFTFLKMRQANFSYLDMSFRYKNQVFAILLDILHNRHTIFSNRYKRNMEFLEFSEKNNMIPCLFPLDMSFAKESTPYGFGTVFGNGKSPKQIFTPCLRDTWNLITPGFKDRINPSEHVTDETIQMSEYEQYNFATEIAKQIIEKNYGSIFEWNDVLPCNRPQVKFINDKRHIREWCCVRVVDKPVNELTENEIKHATREANSPNPEFSWRCKLCNPLGYRENNDPDPLFRSSGIFFLVYIENINRTDLVHNYQYKIITVE